MFELGVDDLDKKRIRQLAYLARYAPGLAPIIHDGNVTLHALGEWVSAISDIVAEENTPEKT